SGRRTRPPRVFFQVADSRGPGSQPMKTFVLNGVCFSSIPRRYIPLFASGCKGMRTAHIEQFCGETRTHLVCIFCVERSGDSLTNPEPAWINGCIRQHLPDLAQSDTKMARFGC